MTTSTAVVKNYLHTISLPSPDPIVIPFATVPTPHYTRPQAAWPEAPDYLNELAVGFRCGQLEQSRTVTRVLELFSVVWEGVNDDRVGALLPDLTYDLVFARDKRPGKWDRVATPRYTIDAAEITGKTVAEMLVGPKNIAAEIAKKMAAAAAVAAAKGQDTTPHLYATPVRLHLKCEAYMVDWFTYVEALGWVGKEQPK